MGYVFDFQDAKRYDQWFLKRKNRFAADLESRLMLGMLDPVAGESVLDIGCGTRLAEAIVASDIPLRRYVGIDVYRELIEHMQREAVDDRLEFHHVNLHNRMYNPDGDLLTLDYRLPVGERLPSFLPQVKCMHPRC